MIEAAQVRAARALIGWSQTKLAETAGVSLSIVERFEAGAPEPIADEAVAKMRAELVEEVARSRSRASGMECNLRGHTCDVSSTKPPDGAVCGTFQPK